MITRCLTKALRPGAESHSFRARDAGAVADPTDDLSGRALRQGQRLAISALGLAKRDKCHRLLSVFSRFFMFFLCFPPACSKTSISSWFAGASLASLVPKWCQKCREWRAFRSPFRPTLPPQMCRESHSSPASESSGEIHERWVSQGEYPGASRSSALAIVKHHCYPLINHSWPLRRHDEPVLSGNSERRS